MSWKYTVILETNCNVFGKLSLPMLQHMNHSKEISNQVKGAKAVCLII